MEEKSLAKWCLVSLVKGKIQDRLFDRNPRLETLATTTTAAYEEWSRLRFKERALCGTHDSTHEPMEIDELTTREKIAPQEREIKTLKQRLASATFFHRSHPATQPRTQSAPTAYQRPHPQKTQTSGVTYYRCRKTGHIRRDCQERKN